MEGNFDANSTPTPLRSNKFVEFLRRFAKRQNTQQPPFSLHPPDETPEKLTNEEDIDKDKQPEEQKETRTQNIGSKVLQALSQRDILLGQRQIEQAGVLALEGTNEQHSEFLFEKVRTSEQSPDGYIVGIGAANVFRMLDLFPEETIPKGIVLFDIADEVVAQGNRFIDLLKSAPEGTQPDLSSLKGILSRKDQEKYGAILQQLAQEGNIVIAKANFLDEKVSEALEEALPDIKNSNNVIYLSNISDHIWRRDGRIPNFDFLNALSPQSPHKNYYVDTLTSGLVYNLRVGTKVPEFTAFDFNNTAYEMLMLQVQTRPSDEIEGPPSENPIWEDTTNWDIQHIIDSYRHIATTQNAQARKKWIEERIHKSRNELLQNYDLYKKFSDMTVEEIEKHVETSENDRWDLGAYRKFILPTDPHEESQILESISKPYSYESDFIPYLSHTFWKDARFPTEVQSGDVPKYRPDVVKENDKPPYIVLDPRRLLKGQIERPYLASPSAIIPYEELVMAKLYRELERRVIAAHSNTSTEEKTFEELAGEFTPAA